MRIVSRERPHRRVAIGTVMKEEEPYILEWVAYHRALGFELIIADNGGNDATSELLRALEQAGACQRIDLTGIKSRPQFPAYRALLRTARLRRIEYIGFIDTDEFFTRQFPPTSLSREDGAEYIVDEFHRLNADQLSYHWLCYGSRASSSDVREPVLKRFTWHSKRDQFWNVNTKSFIRTRAMFGALNVPYLGPPVFSAHYFPSVNRRWFIDGEQVDAFSSQKAITHRTGMVMHFQIKTWDEYQRKISKGDVAFAKNKNCREYFDSHDYNHFETPLSAAFLDSVNLEIEKLRSSLRTHAGLLSRIFDPARRATGKLLSVGRSDVAGHLAKEYSVYRELRRAAARVRNAVR